MQSQILNLQAGEVVDVLSEAEIQATLGDDGTYEGIPFMPEMRRFCGRKGRVYKRADKICVEGSYISNLKDAVMLDEGRCDGADHDGCKRMCMILWKEAWLRHAPHGVVPEQPPDWFPIPEPNVSVPLTGKIYYCQSIDLAKAAKHLILNLHAGEVVDVLSEAEIQATLGDDGTYEGIPFMPEMRRFCGQKARVYKRADKICVEGSYISKLKDAVMLDEGRCDGADHDGCKRMCMIFWKEAWLRRAPPGAVPEQPPDWFTIPEPNESVPLTGKTYYCQSTALPNAVEHLSGWDMGQYVRDITSGSFTPWQVGKAILISFYNTFMRHAGGEEFGAAVGKETKTPAIALNLKQGDLVEVKTKKEIKATIDSGGKNRGLRIDHEMLRHSGRRFRVLRRVDRIILETNGKMRGIQNTVLLGNGACEGLCRRACARTSYPMWREAWLKRID